MAMLLMIHGSPVMGTFVIQVDCIAHLLFFYEDSILIYFHQIVTEEIGNILQSRRQSDFTIWVSLGLHKLQSN